MAVSGMQPRFVISIEHDVNDGDGDDQDPSMVVRYEETDNLVAHLPVPDADRRKIEVLTTSEDPQTEPPFFQEIDVGCLTRGILAHVGGHPEAGIVLGVARSKVVVPNLEEPRSREIRGASMALIRKIQKALQVEVANAIAADKELSAGNGVISY